MTMKMTKKDLKLMMKECIVELIQEGAFNHVGSTSTMMPQPQQMINPMLMGNNPFTGMPMQQQQNPATQMEVFAKQAAAQYAQQFGGSNPAQANMFQHIFEDTIKNTLPQQAMSTEKFPGQEILTETFGEQEVRQDVKKLEKVGDVSRWAKLAFSQRNKLPGQRGANDEDLG